MNVPINDECINVYIQLEDYKGIKKCYLTISTKKIDYAYESFLEEPLDHKGHKDHNLDPMLFGKNFFIGKNFFQLASISYYRNSTISTFFSDLLKKRNLI